MTAFSWPTCSPTFTYPSSLRVLDLRIDTLRRDIHRMYLIDGVRRNHSRFHKRDTKIYQPIMKYFFILTLFVTSRLGNLEELYLRDSNIAFPLVCSFLANLPSLRKFHLEDYVVFHQKALTSQLLSDVLDHLHSCVFISRK